MHYPCESLTALSERQSYSDSGQSGLGEPEAWSPQLPPSPKDVDHHLWPYRRRKQEAGRKEEELRLELAALLRGYRHRQAVS